MSTLILDSNLIIHDKLYRIGNIKRKPNKIRKMYNSIEYLNQLTAFVYRPDPSSTKGGPLYSWPQFKVIIKSLKPENIYFIYRTTT